ncbi:MAG TPA: molybdenum cofactor guanylyltransferase [Terriglobales bacterium]|jgi:molybdopterin-guanine dinucleotide biosynthesis protein A|nr:molybdenum cofactor guanylyltransferase [Terriglobales bacterium]
MADCFFRYTVRVTQPPTDLTAFVLAGGQSSRMGADKAFVEFHGKTLLGRALALARSVTPEVLIVGERARFAAFAPVVEDILPGHGPLGGIHAALTASASELNLILAVDTPLLTPALLRFLVEQARASTAVVTVPRAGGGFQPLCAVYRPAFRQTAEAALQQGRNKIDPLFARVPLRVVEAEELAQFEFLPQMFDNLNTQQDLERAARRRGNPNP